MILIVRTEKPESELGVFSSDGKEISYKKWQAHRQLSVTILSVFEEILKKANIKPEDLHGVIFYEGPGSFTGLRIGASFANALELPTVNSSGDKWISDGLQKLKGQKSDSLALPKYGAGPHITKQKK